MEISSGVDGVSVDSIWIVIEAIGNAKFSLYRDQNSMNIYTDWGYNFYT